MNRIFFTVAFATGLLTITWVGVGFVGSSWLALLMTALIAGVYLLGAQELRAFRAATASLRASLADIAQPLPDIGAWLGKLPPVLQNAVRLRIEGERIALPGPALTPYLVGLLVMLGMLGTFLGMVVTFKGAVFALEGSTDLQAIRTALAAPIKGLGLSFGTSVAGVAASAMLGLLSAISRRERLDVARQLDTCIASVFRPFSLVHQRQETYKALQMQAHALPDVVDKLQAMMQALEHRSQQLNAQLQDSQAQFHRDVSLAYTRLADSVGQSLKDSLTASAKAAGATLQPVVETAMKQMAEESRLLHARTSDAAQTQLQGLTAQFSATAQTVSQTWTEALAQHGRTSEAQVQGLDRALAAFTDTFEQRSGALLSTLSQAVSGSQSAQASADQLRLQAWTQALEAMAASLHGQWQSLAAQTLAQQQAASQTLEKTASEISQRNSAQTSQTVAEMTRLLAQSEALIRSRLDAEALWASQHGERMDQLAGLWRTELAALRNDEAARGDAAVERLGQLQTALASQLATLGAALETPMSRLMQTASEVPQAAAEVIAQLRQEMTRLGERDNQALNERIGLVEQIRSVLQSVNQASGEQRRAIESLIASAADALARAGSDFAQTLAAQAEQTQGTAAHVNSSAIELSTLGESFSHGVQLFNTSNEKLIDSLQRMEGAMSRSMARSDEQLAYYVAQAREVIDLSITSQQGIVEDLRQLRSQPAGAIPGTAG
jgi:hypothetical protein